MLIVTEIVIEWRKFGVSLQYLIDNQTVSDVKDIIVGTRECKKKPEEKKAKGN